MSSTDRTYLENLRAHAADTRTFLSNKLKPERERSVCRAFLRAIGVSLMDGELIAPTVEPADVAFRDARFQVRDLLRERKRGEAWKNNEKRYAEAQSLDDLLEPYSPPTRISLKDLVPEVATALAEKATKYGAGCKDLDALMYVDLPDCLLEDNSPIADTAQLQQQGWRSVSLLFVPYGIVLFANDHAQTFLRSAEKKAQMQWANIDTLFEVQT
jgi:Putative endonuclease, protein of unknown function (DUF1780)